MDDKSERCLLMNTFTHVLNVREGFFYDISLYPRVQKPEKAEGFIRLNKLDMGNEYRLNFPRAISKDIGGIIK